MNLRACGGQKNDPATDTQVKSLGPVNVNLFGNRVYAVVSKVRILE